MLARTRRELMVYALLCQRLVQFNVDVEEEVLRAAINDQLQCAVLEQRKLRHHRILVPILLMCLLIAQPQLDVPFSGNGRKSTHRSSSQPRQTRPDGGWRDKAHRVRPC